VRGFFAVFFDAIRVNIRNEGFVRSKAIHIALGVRTDGGKDSPCAASRPTNAGQADPNDSQSIRPIKCRD